MKANENMRSMDEKNLKLLSEKSSEMESMKNTLRGERETEVQRLQLLHKQGSNEMKEEHSKELSALRDSHAAELQLQSTKLSALSDSHAAELQVRCLERAGD